MWRLVQREIRYEACESRRLEPRSTIIGVPYAEKYSQIRPHKIFLAILACFRKINNTQLYIFFVDLRKFLVVIFNFKNKLYDPNSVYGYVRSYTLGVGYVR